MPFDSCDHTEPRCETEEKCHDRERFRLNLQSIQFLSQAPRSVAVRERDKKFAKDADAYRRLKKDGLQPRGVDNSAMAEARANHRLDIELGRDAHPTERKAAVRSFGAI